MDSVDLDSPEWSGDINNITSVLKLWLRELPDPLLTGYLHPKFLEAASSCSHVVSIHQTLTHHTNVENEENRLRQIRLHEQVNELPDANYATLRYLLGHLHKYGS
jgi:Rho GTPase-activating protein RGD1